MGKDSENKSSRGESQRKESEEEALGRSYVAETPDEDPRYEATGVRANSEGDDSGKKDGKSDKDSSE